MKLQIQNNIVEGRRNWLGIMVRGRLEHIHKSHLLFSACFIERKINNAMEEKIKTKKKVKKSSTQKTGTEQTNMVT